MKINNILESKGKQEVFSVTPDTGLLDAVHLLCNKRVGALLVQDSSNYPIGILTERDVLWEVHRNHENLSNVTVSDVMTSDLICGLPEDDTRYIMQVMTQNKVRHLPIVKDKKVIGMISIGDMIKQQLDEIKVENHRLQDYLAQTGHM